MMTTAILIILISSNAHKLGLSLLNTQVWENAAKFFSAFAFWSILLYFTLTVVICLFYTARLLCCSKAHILFTSLTKAILQLRGRISHLWHHWRMSQTEVDLTTIHNREHSLIFVCHNSKAIMLWISFGEHPSGGFVCMLFLIVLFSSLYCKQL